MKTSLLSTLICIYCALNSVNAQTQQEFKTTTKSVIGYIEYIPKDYYANANRYPVVIFLHGLGQRGPNSTDPAVLATGYNNLVFYGPPMHVKNGTQFPFILISPQLKNNYGDWPGWYIMEVIEHVKTYLRIDSKRIYLTGTSLGGGGAWIGAQDYPDYFAAIAPVMGSTNAPSKACLLAASNLPVWAFHSDDDGVVSYSKSVNMVNAINNCNPPVKAQLRTYHGFGHGAYTPAYDIGYTYQSPNIYDWMLQWVNDHSNKIPKANPGAAQTVTLPASSVTLTGTGTDADGTIVQYNWAQVSGAKVTLTNAATSKVTLSGFATAGTYTFRLVVRDDKGSIASSDVNVFVKNSTNVNPVANAGSNKTVNLPANSITLTGSASDSDGFITSYSWTKISGGAAALSGAATKSLSASGLVAGTYVFRLTVKDDNGGMHYDDVNVYVNYVPSVNAGADRIITLPTNSVTIIGTASDSDGTITSYSWSKVSGPAATLSGTSTATLVAASLTEGTYVLRLTVKDNRGASKSDDITVVVNPATGSNVAPIVSAGSDKIISLPANSVTLTGSASDADGVISSYSWIKLSGGTASLSGANTTSLTVSSLAAGEYVFQLTVKDDDGASRSDDVRVTVNASPVVSAGADRVITLPNTSLTINGSATDSDGTISSLTWTKVSGGAASLSGATTKTLYITGLAAGNYVFRLTAKDNRGASKFDDVSVVVNIPPVPNAGSDRTITLPVNSVSLPGGGSDADGTIISYEWTKVSGGSATLAGASTPTLTVTGMIAGPYTFRLTVTDNRGSKMYDNVNIMVNIPPVPNAGPDKIITLPTNTVVLSGSATDADGTIKYYSWGKVSGGTAALSGQSTPSFTVTNLSAGTYVFRLTVTDNRSAVRYDDVTVTVSSSTSLASLFDADVVGEPAGDELRSSPDLLGGIQDCASCKVIIYNETFNRIYDAKWDASAENRVFDARGLYYFKIIEEGKLLRSGKILFQ